MWVRLRLWGNVCERKKEGEREKERRRGSKNVFNRKIMKVYGH